MKNQVFRIICKWLLAVFATASLAAQTAPTKSTASGQTKSAEEETIFLSPFEVTMTQEKGYNLGNSGNALKTDEKIMDIPQTVSVITRDMIDDLGSGNLSDVLNYAGVGTVFQGDTAMVRGTRADTMMTDGSGDGQAQGPTFDTSMTDSITVVKGPAAVLYGLQASQAGMIQKNTRIPMFKQGGMLRFTTDEYGLMRGELDSTGPLKSSGQYQFAYRLDLTHQDGKGYFKNSDNDRDVAFLAFTMRRPETTFRINSSYQVTKMIPHRNTFLAPDGTPYIGAGRTEDYQPPGMRVRRIDQNLRFQFMHRMFDEWNLQIRGSYNRNSYSQGVMLGNLVDFQNREARFAARWNRLGQKIYGADLNVLGKYMLLNRKAESYLGSNIYETNTNPSYFPGDPFFGTDNAARGVGRAVSATVLAVPMDSPMTELIKVRQEADYYPVLPKPASVTTPVTRGSRSVNQQVNFFYQQKMEVIPNRLTLTASAAQFIQFSDSENIYFPSVPTSQTIAAASAIVRQNKMIHRVGAVFNVTKEIVFYALESTTIVVQSSRLYDGTLTPPRDGKMKEAGIKTDLFNGKISASLAVFDNSLTNVAVSTGLTSPITNLTYVVLIGKQITRGTDGSVLYRPLKNWQISFNWDRHTVTDGYGNGRIPNTNTGSWGFFTRYDFTNDLLRKFAVGGGANRFYGRWINANNNYVFADGTRPATNGSPGALQVMRLKDGTMSTLFIDYKASKRLIFKLTVNNLLDELFAVGAQHAFCIDPSLPRNYQLSVAYKL